MQAVMSNKLWLKHVYLKRIDCSKVKTFNLTFIIIMYMYVIAPGLCQTQTRLLTYKQFKTSDWTCKSTCFGINLISPDSFNLNKKKKLKSVNLYQKM